ncbi:glycosyltransferase [Christiangramia fulva]|uniref:Glycosyltransferase n=1 Tax=Christiangramia fulva TaxID=2126553 RepID=A0A2R3Z2H9_9FLAO|nr:TIGR04282 family arsenosugar biosynthesis glycosyltransferase [Christiangramia fulva]AVR44483.1 glycosyltransferase [Christiangramia fulva]
MTNKSLLIIFTKNPELGRVKTRLAKDIGDENALEIYKRLLAHSKKITAPVKAVKQVFYASEIAKNDLWNEDIYSKKEQKGNDLGERMLNAFQEGFKSGFKNIVIIGTDIFDIETKDIEMAFSSLNENDFVIGPASDGGYYLLGMNCLNSDVFKNKKWSTSSVLQDTLDDLKNHSVKILPQRKDIDVIEDIEGIPAFKKIIEND